MLICSRNPTIYAGLRKKLYRSCYKIVLGNTTGYTRLCHIQGFASLCKIFRGKMVLFGLYVQVRHVAISYCKCELDLMYTLG